MKRLIRAGYYGLLAMAVGIFSFSMFHTLYDIRSGQSSVVKVTALNYWNISQARLELERTIAALDSYAGKLGHVTKDDLIDRFDIFWSRLPLLIEGSQRLCEKFGLGGYQGRIRQICDHLRLPKCWNSSIQRVPASVQLTPNPDFSHSL